MSTDVHWKQQAEQMVWGLNPTPVYCSIVVLYFHTSYVNLSGWIYLTYLDIRGYLVHKENTTYLNA